jgi:hypothetical protein
LIADTAINSRHPHGGGGSTLHRLGVITRAIETGHQMNRLQKFVEQGDWRPEVGTHRLCVQLE